MTRLKVIIYGMALAMSFTSCVREDLDQCPPLRINIEVKDKNYFNVDQTVPDEKRDENQSFRSFVPSLSYRLSRLNDDGTQQVVVEEKGFEVEGDGLTYPVSFDPDMPFGKYVFTVWGGMKKRGELDLGKDDLLLDPEHSQGDDVYQVCDTLVYDENHYCYTSEMERTKGKLVIWSENLPAGYNVMDTEVSDLYGIVNPSFQYSEETSVFQESEIKAGAKTKTSIFLPPSFQKDESVVDVYFRKNSGEGAGSSSSVLKPDDVKVSMERNKITVLKYVYDSDRNRFTIYMKVNDNWEEIHGMILD